MESEPRPRFVILRHVMPMGDTRASHWDFMLESGASLRTWALAAEPVENLQIAAQAIADHRLQYLDYEGPISAGRGEVIRWDAGQYSLENEHADELVIQLIGCRLRGRATLSREPADNQRWTFSFVDESNSA
jgi:hypothetical protein